MVWQNAENPEHIFMMSACGASLIAVWQPIDKQPEAKKREHVMHSIAAAQRA